VRQALSHARDEFIARDGTLPLMVEEAECKLDRFRGAGIHRNIKKQIHQ
jgi:hypothetical protein